MAQEWRNYVKNRVKVTLSVEGGWTNQDSFEMDCNGLEELSTLAKVVGVKLILVEAEEFHARAAIIEAWTVLVSHMEQQEVMLERLTMRRPFQKLERPVELPVELPAEGPILPLLELSKRWEIGTLVLPQDLDHLFWTKLANIPTSGGHIGHICFPPGAQYPLDQDGRSLGSGVGAVLPKSVGLLSK